MNDAVLTHLIKKSALIMISSFNERAIFINSLVSYSLILAELNLPTKILFFYKSDVYENATYNKF